MKSSHDAPSELFPPLEKIDALEFLARVITQIPEPRRHLLFYYGYYANVVRGRRQSLRAAEPSDSSPNQTEELEPTESPPFKAGFAPSMERLDSKSLRARPALYLCGGTLRVVAFITEPRVIRKNLDHLNNKANGGRAPPLSLTMPSA